MAESAAASPIVIKKIKKGGGHGHHGGAWKVAYADFVTAMMAFFLLMWLLNATTEEQRKGLADYFNPSIPVSRVSGGGKDALDGSSLMAEGDLARDGSGENDDFPRMRDWSSAAPPRGTDRAAHDESLEAVRRAIERAEAAADPALGDQIEVRMTPEGLSIELVDADGAPLFAVGSARPSPLLADLLAAIAPVLARVTNDMAVVGHTDGRAFAPGAAYSNWELSADRANAARRLLVEAGVDPAQIDRVAGRADRDPLVPEDPGAARNRRIAVTLLRLPPEAARP